jgi:hypothetical protein
MAALAALAGLTDVLGDPQIRGLNDAWLHAGGNVIVVLIELFNWYSRYEHGAEAVLPVGLGLSFIVVLILLFTGWKGGRWFTGIGSVSSMRRAAGMNAESPALTRPRPHPLLIRTSQPDGTAFTLARQGVRLGQTRS